MIWQAKKEGLVFKGFQLVVFFFPQELEQLLEDQDKQSPQALTQLSVWFQENNILIEETKLVQSELVTKRETVVEQVRINK